MPEKLDLGECKEKGLKSGFLQVRNGSGAGGGGCQEGILAHFYSHLAVKII